MYDREVTIVAEGVIHIHIHPVYWGSETEEAHEGLRVELFNAI